MNALDFINYCKDKTEEELKDIEIQGWWEVDNIEGDMEDQDIPVDEFTREEKRNILHNTIVDFGDCTTEEINNQLYAAVADLHDTKQNAKQDEI